MKKYLTLILLFFFISTNSCFAYSKLYYLKSVEPSQLESLIHEELTKKKFNIIKTNPYYATSKDDKDYAVVILQKSADNCFYYYESNDEKRLNKRITNAFKRRDIVYEESFNTNIIDIYNNLAKRVINNNEYKYDFEETPAKKFEEKKPNLKDNSVLRGSVATIPSNFSIPIYLQTSINTANATVGDQVVAIVSQDIDYNGHVVFPQGSAVYGYLSRARAATYGSRNGRVVINFEKIITPDNKTYSIQTEKVDFTVSNEGKVLTSTKSIVKAAAIGAVTGLLVALFSSDRNAGTAAAIGAGIGAGSSLVYNTVERGVDAEIPSYTELELLLARPVNFVVTH